MQLAAAYTSLLLMALAKTNGLAKDASDFDCDQGCPSDYDPVCDERISITVQNMCVAECQGIPTKSISPGPCMDDKEAFENGQGPFLGSEGMSHNISPKMMNKFADDGFMFVGVVDFLDEGPGQGDEEALEPMLLDEEDGPPDAEMFDPVALRYDADSHALYAAKIIDSNNEAVQPEGPPSMKMSEAQSRLAADDLSPRELHGQTALRGQAEPDAPPMESVIGVDTRKLIQNTRVYPFWRIGEFDWTGEGGCSGTVVGKNSVLTAAHCVYSTKTKSWRVPKRFAPGRYRATSGRWTTIEPWGTWDVQSATMYRAYLNRDVNYDVAIVHMKPNSRGRSIGDYMGTLRMDTQCFPSYSSHRIVGYPADKPDGQMWSSGVCESWKIFSCDSLGKRIYHKCDTFGGHSGSPMYNDRNKEVFGVHTHGRNSQGYNSGVKLTSSMIKALTGWFK